jgi:hypothetical protein
MAKGTNGDAKHPEEFKPMKSKKICGDDTALSGELISF